MDLWLHLSFLLYGWVRISAVNQVIGNRVKFSRIRRKLQNPRALSLCLTLPVLVKLGMPRSGHPTKTKLVDTTVELLRSTPRAEITTDLILNTSGISKGSLYHHFEDLEELIESAMLVRYTDWVDSSIGLIMQIITRSKTPEDVYNNLVELTRFTQDPKRRAERIYRAEVLGIAVNSPRLAKRLGEEQQRLTDALIDIIRDTQENGYFKKDLDPHSIAVLIQAYTLGKVVDDYSPTPVDPESWNALINAIIRRIFIGLD